MLSGKADGFSRGARPAGASDAMDIVLRVLRQIVVDHVADTLDVNTAPRHIRGDHHSYVARTEVLKRPDSLLLSNVPGYYGATDAMSRELIRQSASLIPPVAEDENPIEVQLGNHIVEDSEPLPRPNEVQHLLD